MEDYDMKKICIVIPIYREIPGEIEVYSIERCISQLSGIDVFFIAPNKLKIDWYKKKFPNIHIIHFSRWKNNIQTYSKLLLSVDFYKSFINYEYMLISQTDALILGNTDNLLDFCNDSYDYIGAPWTSYEKDGGREIPKYIIKKWQKNKLVYQLANVRRCMVGNGGLSLRKIHSFIMLLQGHRIASLLWSGNEDLFFSYYDKKLSRKGEKSLHIPSVETASRFALEEQIEQHVKNGDLPFGVHAWEKDFPGLINII